MTDHVLQFTWGHVNVNVCNLERSIALYEKLGFESYRPDIPYMDLTDGPARQKYRIAAPTPWASRWRPAPEASVLANRYTYWSVQALIKKAIMERFCFGSCLQRHQLGLMSDWHFKSLNIELRRRGFKNKDPKGSPKKQSQF